MAAAFEIHFTTNQTTVLLFAIFFQLSLTLASYDNSIHSQFLGTLANLQIKWLHCLRVIARLCCAYARLFASGSPSWSAERKFLCNAHLRHGTFGQQDCTLRKFSAEALVDVVRRGDVRDVVREVVGQVELAQLRLGALVVVAQLAVHRLQGEKSI